MDYGLAARMQMSMTMGRPMPGPTGRWTRLRAVVAMASLVIGSLAAVTVLSPPAGAATVQDAANSAVALANSRGERAAVAVYDRQTGVFTGAGDVDSFYASASLVKVAIAGQLLVTGQMASVEGTAWAMITGSSDSAANALYGRVGGDSVMNTFADRYGLGGYFAPPAVRGWWGITRVTAHGMVLLYAAIANDPAVGPWLMNAMANASCTATDGYPQCFGIPAATNGWRIKQGWTANDPGDGAGYIHSTGYVNNDRYAVALLTSGSAGIYGSYGNATSSMMAQTLMPGGQIEDPAAHNPRSGGGFDHASADGYTVTLAGWAYDPDNLNGQIEVHIYEGSRGLFPTTTADYRPDVNAAFGLGGNHGYTVRFTATEGVHNYCAFAINQGAGTANPVIGCATVTVRPTVRSSYAIDAAGATGSGMVEVHTVSRASGFAQWSGHYATALALVPDPQNWLFRLASFQGDGRANLWAVHFADTGSGHVEVHILSEVSGYQSWIAHFATPLAVNPAAWRFDIASYAGDRSSNLYAIGVAGTGSGKVEMHVLSEASGFQAYIEHAATAIDLPATPDQFSYMAGDRGGRGDLNFISRYGNGSGQLELHAVSRDSGYKGWSIHSVLPTANAPESTTQFRLMDYDGDGVPELFIAQLANSGTSSAELHVLSGSSGYQGWVMHTGTAMGYLDTTTTTWGVVA